MSKLDIYRTLSTNKKIDGISDSVYKTIKSYGTQYESLYDVNRQTFLEWLSGKKLSAASKATVASALAKYYHVMGDMSKEDRDIIIQSFRAPQSTWGDKSLDDKVISKSIVLASRATNEFTARRNSLIIVMLASYGIRVGQLVAMDYDDIWQEDNYVSIKVDRQKERMTQLNKLSSIKKAGYDYKPVASTLHGLGYYVDRYLEVRDDYAKDNNALFVSLTGTRLTSTYIQIMTKAIGDNIGVELTPHCFRHHVASKVTKKFGIVQAAVLLDHKNITTTQRYLSPDDFDTKEVFDGLQSE
jgi:site-specific recombinase XerD